MIHFFRLCFLLILFETGALQAQQLSPVVVSTSGGFYSNASSMLSFTVGEMTAIQTYTGPSSILTQGFQQDWEFTTSVFEHPAYDFSMSIFPNPTDGNFNLTTEGDAQVNVQIRIYDVLGQQCFQTSFNHQEKSRNQPIDLSNAPPGVYSIVLITKTHSTDPGDHFTDRILVIR